MPNSNGRGCPEKYTVEQVAEAIKASKGLIYVAARKLGCSPRTLHRYSTIYPSIRELIQAERGLLVDHAEAALWRGIQQGNSWAVMFTLKTLGKDRGYVERREHTGMDGGPIELRAVRDLSDEELLAIAAGGGPAGPPETGGPP